MTKKEFAKRCQVSIPTVYAWIGKNRDGIQEYVTADGINDEIFFHEPWTRYHEDERTEAEKLEDKNADLIDELNDACKNIATLRQDVEHKEQTITQLQQTIDLLRSQLAVKDQQINALLVSLNQQMKALPKPRRTLKEFFTGKSKNQE